MMATWKDAHDTILGKYQALQVEHAELKRDLETSKRAWNILHEAAQKDAAAFKEQLAAKDETLKVAKEALKYYAEQPPPHTYYIVEAKDRSFLSDMADWGVKAQDALAALEARKDK